MKTRWIWCALALSSAALAQEAVVALFDGKALTGWTTVAGKPVTTGWEVTDGTIHRATRAMDIVTEKNYENFDLTFDWKLSSKTNSGLKYRYGKYGQKMIGIEYQLIDSEKPGDNKGKHGIGSLYDLFPPDPKANPKPVGEWNLSRIRAEGKKITHWLNGVKTVDVTVGSPEWDAALAQSKFKETPDFGTKPGKILLQEHGGEVWFRNLQLKPL